MQRMWLVEKSDGVTIQQAVVFNRETLNDYLADGYAVSSKWELKLVDGNDCLPDSMEK